MGKLKPHKGLKKRVKVTAKGKIIRHKAGKRHLMSSKSSKRRRRLKRTDQVAAVERKTVLRLLGKG